MKRWISLVLSLVMTLIAVQSVAVAETELAPATISFWKSPHSDHEEQIWQGIIEKFNEEYPQITVEFLSVPWDSVNEKEMAAFASNTPPDVSFQVEQYQVYAEAGRLVDLNQYASVEKVAGYAPSAIEYCTYDGKLMGIPFIALNTVMFYNKDIFAAEGLEIPTTWEEMIDVAQKCTKDTDGDGTIDQWGMLLATKPSCDMWQGVNFIEESGADLWNETRDNIGFNNDTGYRGLQLYQDLFNTYCVVPPIDTFSSSEEEKAAFYNGHIAMWPNQIQESANIRTAVPDMNFGAFLMPAGPAEDADHANWAFGNIGMLSIATDSQYPDQAWAFVEFITRPEIERDFLSEVGFFSPQTATNETMYQDDEVMKLAADGIKNLQCSPASKYFQGVYDGMNTLLESLARGVQTPQEAVADLESKMNALVE